MLELNMEYQAAQAHQRKKEKSIARTIERYTGTLCMISTWEQSPEPDFDYLKELYAKATKLRSQLRMKGVMCDKTWVFDQKNLERKGVANFMQP